MKIVFEHQGRKTTILGNDYETIVSKIRLLFPDQSHHRIQFYDPELIDYFEFTSYEQVIDQPNGLRMNFDVSLLSESILVNSSILSVLNDNGRNQANETIEKLVPVKKPRKKASLQQIV